MTNMGGIAKDVLRSFIERIERLEQEKGDIVGNIRDVYAEAKANGFDTRIIKKMVKLRKQTPEQRQEEDILTDLYMGALGMLPLFEAAEKQEEKEETVVSISSGKKKVVFKGGVKELVKAADTSAKIIEHLSVIKKMGVFTPSKKEDEKFIQHMEEMGYMEKSIALPGSWLLTKEAEKLIAGH